MSFIFNKEFFVLKQLLSSNLFKRESARIPGNMAGENFFDFEFNYLKIKITYS